MSSAPSKQTINITTSFQSYDKLVVDINDSTEYKKLCSCLFPDCSLDKSNEMRISLDNKYIYNFFFDRRLSTLVPDLDKSRANDYIIIIDKIFLTEFIIYIKYILREIINNICDDANEAFGNAQYILELTYLVASIPDMKRTINDGKIIAVYIK